MHKSNRLKSPSNIIFLSIIIAILSSLSFHISTLTYDTRRKSQYILSENYKDGNDPETAILKIQSFEEQFRKDMIK